ncbi:MAG: glutaminase A [Ilumatobacteraceae bacterium]
MITHPGAAEASITEALERILDRHRADGSGEVASYIPELAHGDPNGFGVALASVNGHVHCAGDTDRTFTIQSVSKPFVYALAVAELGLDQIDQHIGFEPSGEPFNAISLDETTGRPANPLINAGAIVTSSLIPGASPVERFERVRSFLSQCAGRDLTVDEDVFRSELLTGDRNRALGYLAKSSGVLGQSVDDATEVYFRQCSLLVTTADIAVMAATFANGGVNPVTGIAVVPERVVTLTLSVMATCGMYDRSGEWMARVGLPAKSGVGGGITAVHPAHFGIGVYSPRLDGWGNSVRGSAVLQSLSEDFDLHVFDHPDAPRSPIVSWTAEGPVLHVVLRGELDLISCEEIGHRLEEWERSLSGDGHSVHLDVTGVTRVRVVARRLFAAMQAALAVRDISVTVIGNLEDVARTQG